MSEWNKNEHKLLTHTQCVTFSDVCTDVADVKSQEEEEEREDNSFSENGMNCAEGVTDPRTCTHTHVNSHRYAFWHLSIMLCILAIALTPVSVAQLLFGPKTLQTVGRSATHPEIWYNETLLQGKIARKLTKKNYFYVACVFLKGSKSLSVHREDEEEGFIIWLQLTWKKNWMLRFNN